MLQKYSIWRVLRVFFDDPNPAGTGFQLREIGRKAKLAPPSVKRYLDELSREGARGYPLIIKGKHRLYDYPVYWGNRASELFLFYKKLDTVVRLNDTGLLDHLWDSCAPDTIILFGSASRGEDVRESDIDLFVQSKDKKLELGQFEKKLGRRINVFFAEEFAALSKELKNNMLNGVVLKGYVKVF